MIRILWPFVKPRPFIPILLDLLMLKRGKRFLDFNPDKGEGQGQKARVGWRARCESINPLNVEDYIGEDKP